MTTREYAPEPNPGEHPEDYILRLALWLNEPHRRRLGGTTVEHVTAAIQTLKDQRIGALLTALSEAAILDIESMEEIEHLRAAAATANDLADRIEGQLKSLGA